MVRLQKYLADAGVASRRASEQIIVNGRVTVNGKVADQLGSKVEPLRDRICVDSRPIKPKRKLYIALNKPRRCLCTRRKEDDRLIVGDLLPQEWDNLYTVGRLDYDSEGLIFLTNDGDFSLKLTHPRYGVSKTYRVAVAGRVSPEVLKKFISGVELDEEVLKARRARVLSSNNTQSLVEIELAEGKNREIRRLFESQGLTVASLQRIRIGPIHLGQLPVGKWRTLTEPEIKSLLLKL